MSSDINIQKSVFAGIKKFTLDIQRTMYYLRHVWSKISGESTKMNGTTRSQFYSQMWLDAARTLSIDVVHLPDGFLEVRSGNRTTRMYESLTMLDHPATMHLAMNKPLVHTLLAKEGLPVPPHRQYTLRNLEAAIQFLESQDARCVVKPAKGTGGGEAVTTNVRTIRQLKRASLRASLYCNEILIEKQIPGDSYRLLYLDERLIDAVLRRPPSVVGDGHSTIQELIEAENRRRKNASGKAALQFINVDLDCITTLKNAGFSLRSVPQEGSEVQIKLASNDSSDRENESLRSSINQSVIEGGAKAASICSLRLAGVDIITTDPTMPLENTGGVINEVNATPGLHFHYQTKHPEHRVAVAVPILRALLDLQNGSNHPLHPKGN